MSEGTIFALVLLALILFLIVMLLDPTKVFRLPRLNLERRLNLTDNRCTEFIVINNTGGRPLYDVLLMVTMKISVDNEKYTSMADLEGHVMFPLIDPKEKKEIMILETDYSPVVNE